MNLIKFNNDSLISETLNLHHNRQITELPVKKANCIVVHLLNENHISDSVLDAIIVNSLLCFSSL